MKNSIILDLFLLFCVLGMPSVARADFAFQRYYVDQNYGGNGAPGFVRAGDMDNDSDLDITAGGGRALFVYENDGNPSKPDWTRHGNLDPTGDIGLNGACISDVDGDGDLDIVGAKYYSDLGWWENPGPPLTSTPWTFHKLATATEYLHDFMLADLDGDGRTEEFIATLNSGGYWNTDITLKWFRPGADPTGLWESHTIESGRNEGSPHCHAGLDTGDVDNDGHLDIAFSNGWYEAPDDTTGTWVWHEVTTIYGISNTRLRDIDTDGDVDMIVSAGHHGDGVYLLYCPQDPISEVWLEEAIDALLLHPEGLAALDLDEDGDCDVVACDLDFDHWNQEVHQVYVYENTGTQFLPSWNKQDISGPSYASHKLQMADINNDSRMDIISEGCGYRIVTYFENVTPDTVGVSEDETHRKKEQTTVSMHLTNPVSGSARLRFWFTAGRTGGVLAQVWDVAGRLVAEEKILPSQGSYQFAQPLNLSSGSYILIVQSEHGSAWRRNFQTIR